MAAGQGTVHQRRAADRRRTAEERREHVIAAAVSEFAAHGYHGASTAAIAKRAGISQPYIYALFPSKRDLFLAATRHVGDHIRRTFGEAAAGAGSAEARMLAMGRAYMKLLESRDEILCQLQGFAAAGDPEIRESIRGGFMKTYDEVERLTGAPRPLVHVFMGAGMLLNVAAALDLPPEYRPVPPMP